MPKTNVGPKRAEERATSAFSKLAPHEQRMIRREAAKLRVIIDNKRSVETPAEIVALAQSEK